MNSPSLRVEPTGLLSLLLLRLGSGLDRGGMRYFYSTLRMQRRTVEDLADEVGFFCIRRVDWPPLGALGKVGIGYSSFGVGFHAALCYGIDA